METRQFGKTDMQVTVLGLAGLKFVVPHWLMLNFCLVML